MNQIVHRDLKHMNIFLSNMSQYPKVQIADFGVACYLAENEYHQGKNGTAVYMAPELVEK